MAYHTLWAVRHVMPDDRLATATVDVDADVIVVALRYGYVHPALARSMAAYSKAFADSDAFDLAGGPPGAPWVSAWFEGVADERHTADGLMRASMTGSGPWAFEVLVRRDMIDPAMIRELNLEVMPTACGLLVPRALVGAL